MDAIYGLRPVFEAIEAGKNIEKVYFKKGAEGQLISELRDLCRSKRITVQEVPAEKLDWLTRRATHQGVVAQMALIEYADLNEVLESIPEGDDPLIVVFDGVTDIRNFGAVARSAECAGAHALIVPVKNAAPVNADAVKSSAGALTRIPVCRVGSIRSAIKTLQAHEILVVAATEKANKELFFADLKGPTALVMGSEDQGISSEVLKICDQQVSIPMKGKVASLNVSAAAAVMLFEAVRQRMK